MLDFLNYSFIVRALVVGGIFSAFAALLGNFLVASKKSTISDMIAHFSLAGVGIAIYLSNGLNFWPLTFGIFASFLLMNISRNSKINKEAFNILILSLGISIAIFLVTLSPSSAVSLESYLFGSILTISKLESQIILGFLAIASILILSFYNRFFTLCLDPEFLNSKFKNQKFYEYLLLLIVSIFVGLSLKIVGGLLVSAFLVISVLSAQQIAKSFEESIVLSVIFNIFATLSGIIASYYFNIPSSSAIIFILVGIFSICFSIKKLQLHD